MSRHPPRPLPPSAATPIRWNWRRTRPRKITAPPAPRPPAPQPPPTPPQSAQQTRIPIKQPKMANSAVARNKAAAQIPVPPTPPPVPSPIPPKAQPQMPQAPEPTIPLNRASQPESEPDLSKGPAKEHDDGGGRRENDTPANNSNRSPNSDMDRDSDRDDDHYSIRTRGNDPFN